MLLQRLVEYAERDPDILPSMYQNKPVRYEIRLDADGRQVGPVLDLADPANKATKRGQVRLVPHRKRAAGIAPILLADNAEYVLGIPRETSRPERVAKQHRAFVEVLRECARDTNETAVRAVLRFLTEEGPGRRSDIEISGDLDLTRDFGFVVDGARPVDLPSVRAFWAGRFAQGADDGSSPERVPGSTTSKPAKTAPGPKRLACIVCGNVRPVLERHPLKIKGIPGGQASGTDLISANATPFESYGLTASEIAPTCQECGEKYANALNALLASDATRVRVGNVVAYVFWTASESTFNAASLFTEPDSDAMTGQVGEMIQAYKTGRSAALDIDPMPFYAVALSANSSRAVVREWIDRTVGEAKRTLGRYFALQEMVERDGTKGRALPVWRLASATVRTRSGDAPSPTVPAALLGLALRGGPLPLDIAFQAIRRCRIEGVVSRERAALIKMVLGSQPRTTPEEITRMTDLDPTRTDPAYLCGRLLAVLDAVQYAALRQTNATVVDKFYGTASSAPASVFGTLLGNAQPHLARLRKERPGVYRALECRMEEVLDQLHVFPKTLTLPDQGLFALGYYHQRAADRRAAREAKERGQADVAEVLGNDAA